jgi:hypothetical protein
MNKSESKVVKNDRKLIGYYCQDAINVFGGGVYSNEKGQHVLVSEVAFDDVLPISNSYKLQNMGYVIKFLGHWCPLESYNHNCICRAMHPLIISDNSTSNEKMWNKYVHVQK